LLTSDSMKLNTDPVDYILFLTADVTVAPNTNEIQDYKYVDKAELQAMFEDPSTLTFLLRVDLGTDASTENTFTPWFKLIARDFLFGWWDELVKRKNVEGKVVAKSLAGFVDGTKVIKMV
jgi:isopentenyl-diphosphate delta-isomerase